MPDTTDSDSIVIRWNKFAIASALLGLGGFSLRYLNGEVDLALIQSHLSGSTVEILTVVTRVFIFAVFLLGVILGHRARKERYLPLQGRYYATLGLVLNYLGVVVSGGGLLLMTYFTLFPINIYG